MGSTSSPPSNSGRSLPLWVYSSETKSRNEEEARNEASTKFGEEPNLFKQLISDQAHYIGQSRHVSELYGRPFPAAGFPADDSQGAHTLHGEHIEDHEGDAAGQCIYRAAIFTPGGLHTLMQG